MRYERAAEQKTVEGNTLSREVLVMPLSHIPGKWDGEADVIVVGAGTAGLPAAITAKDRGAEVIVLEAWSGSASSLALIAGGTPFAGTDLQKEAGIDDSPDKLFKEAVEISGGFPELWRVIADRQLETYEWFKGLGAKPAVLGQAPGHREVRGITFEGGGANLLKILKKAAEERGIETVVRHRAERLITDQVSGRVIGVRAKHEDKDIYFRAKNAVILANGGFIRNREMVKEYGPSYIECVPVTPPTHMGDGLKMALDIGAATAGIGLAVCPSISVCTETNHTTIMPVQGGIAVTREGKRWADENGSDVGSYNVMFRELMRQCPDGLHFVIYDSHIREEAFAKDYLRVKEYQADTIEEVAKTVGLKPEALVETVNEYNSDIDKFGYDKKFGKREWGGSHRKETPPKIDKPPFYAIKCKVSLSSLKGGVKINTKAQVVDNFGEVIPGFYAAGEVAGGFVGIPEAYWTGTMTLQAFVFGRIAGENAAAEVGN